MTHPAASFALAGYRLLGADMTVLAQDFAEAASRMNALNRARGQRLAPLGPAVLAMKRSQWPEALQIPSARKTGRKR